jgi:predicted nucleic acid-binding Zn ribbon protein
VQHYNFHIMSRLQQANATPLAPSKVDGFSVKPDGLRRAATDPTARSRDPREFGYTLAQSQPWKKFVLERLKNIIYLL